ncbi:protein-disulfide reductase DsbD family protein [Moellerella wisconsensis]|uniref:protein-disulfide reductase DsbD family protein n=1 Tax=Moellerella wisconsensis TaxID=158849 RepID=UPI00241014E2|nr:protein-disulfide reductase DsbD domain-containing protein [Moellerella wisconsensis]
MRFIINSFLTVIIFFSINLHAADSGWLTEKNNSHAAVRLLSSAPINGHIELLLDIKLAQGWKTYWRSPGEGGIAPEIKWQSPVEASQWFWPTPHRFDVAGISTQGYSGDVSLPIELKVSESLKSLAGVLTLSTCSNVCVLTDYPFELDLTQSAPGDFAWLFNQAKGTVPAEKGLVEQATVGFTGNQLVINLNKTNELSWQQPELFIDYPEGTALSVPKINSSAQTLTAIIDVTDDWGDSAPDLSGETLSFVVVDHGVSQQIKQQITPHGGNVIQINTSTSSLAAIPLWQMVAFALLGGLILNLMPCVLPVLAMKLGSILYVPQGQQQTIRRQFLLSSSGILASFWLLALFMTLLRAGQQVIGWGIQFQNPWFIGFMVLVTALFSANLLGLFEINLGSKTNTRLATLGGQGNAGHFWQGVFATLLATPCSAPFLGTAVAFALAAPIAELWLIFTALGIGMSLPWLLIAAFPAVARLLPKPGRWMNILRAVLGAMMLISCLWLISLMSAHIGYIYSLIIAIILLLVLLIFIAKHYGYRVAAMTFLLFSLLAAGFAWSTYSDNSATNRSLVRDSINWQPLTQAAIDQALSENKRVFVDVTADWCVTCKANKYNVLLRDDVQQALSAPDVVALRGDWTKPSAEINQFLQQRGQVAVPFNQIYGTAIKEGKILSTLLDREELLSVLNQASTLNQVSTTNQAQGAEK